MGHNETFLKIPGGQSIVDWFGSVPRFHDANILEMNFSMGAACSMRIHAWNMTRETDPSGHYVLDKHAVVEVTFASVSEIHLDDFDMKSIIFGLELKEVKGKIEVSWDVSYGAVGKIVGDGASLKLIPGKP